MLGKAWRTLLVIALGLGLSWAAGRIGSGPPSVLNLDDVAEPLNAEPESVGQPSTVQPGAEPVRELSAAEVEAELKNVEKALSGGPDPGEVAADKPLPADLGVALPSDI
jgi:hypothetical protein